MSSNSPDNLVAFPKGQKREEFILSEEGLDGAFRRFSPYVATIAYRMLGRDDELDDVVQDVFLDAHKGLHTLRDPKAIKGWLATITVNVVRRRLRKRKLKRFIGLDDVGPVYQQIEAPGATAEQRAVLASVMAKLDKLPVDVRIAWSLRHIEEMKLQEVADACSCSLATAKRRIAQAQTFLDEVLNERA